MRARGVVAALWIGVSTAFCASAAQADRPVTTYRWADPARVEVAEPGRHASNVLYLDRCAGGCTIAAGFDDSRIDTSSLVPHTVTITEFAHDQAAWDAVVACVRDLYAPFRLEVTDVDPGEAPHFEAIVAGSPADLGATGIGGLSPFACGVIDNAVTYSFANIYGSARDICETVAQETAHAFGLEHEYLCADPMTYLTGCGDKSFQDIDAPCGEYGPRDCECGGATQSSYQKLVAEFGRAGEPEAPAPEAGAPPEVDEPIASAGCRVAGGRGGAPAWLGLVAAIFVLRRRRR
jgi:MYXO-CTERM domain-containing protein